MALDDDAVQAKERGAVVAPVIVAAAKGVDRRQREESADFGEDVASKFGLERAPDHLRHALGGFQRDISDKPVADYDVGAPLEDIVAFDIAEKMNLATLVRCAQ